MNDTQQKEAAKQFASYWKGKGYEKGESQAFWLSLLRDVYGVEHPEQFITFEEQVHLDHTSFIDGTIPSTKVLIEQKGLGKDLKKPIKQSDGTLLTPFQQAKRYITELPLSQHPRWVVTCNFEKFFGVPLEKMYGFELWIAKRLGFINEHDGTYEMTLKGAFYYHYYENFYTLSYIDKMWGIMRKEAFPEQIEL